MMKKLKLTRLTLSEPETGASTFSNTRANPDEPHYAVPIRLAAKARHAILAGKLKDENIGALMERLIAEQ